MNGQQAVAVLAAAARGQSGQPTVIPRALAEGDARPSGVPLPARARRAWAAARRSFWHEMHLELRRHAGDGRLSVDFRGSLRRLAQRASGRAARPAGAADLQLPRRLLREPLDVRLPEDLERLARQQAVAAGIDMDAPLVALELRNRPDVFAGAIELLSSRGMTIVRLGGGAAGPIRRPGLVDLSTSPQRTPLLELFIVSCARFVVGGGSDLQFVSYLVNTPSLTVNGSDPFTLYPVRSAGLYLLRAAIDLESGRELGLHDMLAEAYFRNLRHYGHREHASSDVTAAVVEMLEGIEGGWCETDAQSRYRVRLGAAAARLAPATWGPDAGFLGDGRLARVQAERLS
jgi:putative glycosyltransferase (TIGR04372 family)